jgi:RND family efflux transporter MFP subunit
MRILRPWAPLVALALACSSSSNAPANKGRPPPLVTSVKVEARDVPVEVHAPVDLRPLAQADVGAKTLGYLDAVLVDRGDKVKKGQLLAVVRPSDLPDQLSAARGSLAQAQASLALAKTNHDRAQLLAPKGVVSQQELQQTSAALASAEAAEAAARANLGVMATRLGETRLEAPIDGYVLARRVDPGALVGPATGAIVTVARTDVLRVFVAVTERDAAGVAVGKEAHVEVDALPGRRFGGRVARVAPAFDVSSRTLDAEVHLDNREGLLRPGMYGRGAIRVEVHPNAVVAPISAVLTSGNKRYVFVVEGDKVKRREVRTGVDGGEWLEILEGLKAGEELVTAGAEGLADGATVRVAKNVDPYSGKPVAGSPKP